MGLGYNVTQGAGDSHYVISCCMSEGIEKLLGVQI
jgi:hypothetical protein